MAPDGPEPPRVPTERPGPVGGKRDRNRRRRTQALLDAALELFLAQGVQSVSVEAIARAAGLAKGSFYRYFADKGELVSALLAPLAETLDRGFEACASGLAEAEDGLSVFLAYNAFGALLAEAVRERPDVARLYLQEGRGPAVGARAPVVRLARSVVDRSVELTRLAQARGQIRAVDPRVSTLTVVGAAERLLQSYLEGDWSETDGARLVGEVVGIALEGLRPE